jgi:hypothetical protein
MVNHVYSTVGYWYLIPVLVSLNFHKCLCLTHPCQIQTHPGVFSSTLQLGLLVDSEIVLSTRYGKTMVWCGKFNSTSNVLVCETQRKVNMYGCVSE